MSWVNNVFSIYIDIVMLCIGLYMALVQGRNLVQVDHMNKEGRFTQVIGWIYIAVAIIGFILLAIF